jgi:hypothetical protein
MGCLINANNSRRDTETQINTERKTRNKNSRYRQGDVDKKADNGDDILLLELGACSLSDLERQAIISLFFLL